MAYVLLLVQTCTVATLNMNYLTLSIQLNHWKHFVIYSLSVVIYSLEVYLINSLLVSPNSIRTCVRHFAPDHMLHIQYMCLFAKLSDKKAAADR